MTRTGRSSVALVALLLVVGLGLGSTPAITRAATPDLTLVAATTYDVLPNAGRVSASSKVTAANHLHDTATKRYFFQTAYLAVLPGTSNFKISTPGATPTVSVSSRKATYTLLKLNFGKPLAAGKSVVLTLTFDLKDPGGAPDRALRISPSIVSFSAWAFATASTPGSSVTIRFPAGYTVTIGRGPMTGPTTDSQGRFVWSSGRLNNPLTFIVDVTADRPGDYVERSLSATIGKQTALVTLRSWPDDQAWRDRVGSLLTHGMPRLASQIGLGWPIADPLIVQEALVRTTGGYAGLFDPSTHRILISYTAAPSVVLHEAAHAWFNGHLVADRWAAEAFASYYADTTASALKVKVTAPTLTNAVRKSAFPLNGWGPIGSASPATETYGYAASLAFARAVAKRAGPEAMKAVWAAAAAGGGAYQPPNGDEPLGQVPDWRGLLDLLEDKTGTSFDDLWRKWIARPEDLPLLDARAAARAAYDSAVKAAAPWTLPRSIRDAMRTWHFDVALQELGGVRTVIGQRRELEQAAAAAALTLPPTLRSAFEGDRGLPAAAAEATAELTTIDVIRQAAATEPRAGGGSLDALIAVGLLGAEPAERLAEARAAFAQGMLDNAIDAASEAAASWSSAAEIGRTRIVSLGLLALAVLLFGRMLVLWRRRWLIAAAARRSAQG
jgi:hypothetical protein